MSLCFSKNKKNKKVNKFFYLTTTPQFLLKKKDTKIDKNR